MMISLPLAAGGGDVVLTILFGLISVGAWIINAVKNNQEAEKKRTAGTRRPKDQKVRREIEEFLQQQSGRPSRPMELGPGDVELVEETPRSRPSPVVRPKKTPKSSKKPVASTPLPAAPKPTPVYERRPSAAPTRVSKRGEAPQGIELMGSALKEHVSTAMAERVVAQVERDLPHLVSSVADKVRQDLGEFSVSGKTTPPPRTGSNSLIEMLHNPKTARQAVLMSEIMGRPKALRNK